MTAIRRSRLCAAVLTALLPAALPALAQDAASTTDTAKAKTLDRVTVTGSRIKQTNKVTSAPVAIITRETIDKSGSTSVGEYLQTLTASGKALNPKFNSSGNFGYPPDGGGIGAGSSEVDLRNLGSNRVLVLVDGIRWVNESSASGVSGSADLNTIPLSIVDRIEVLEDGASAIYGSDAIAGVINIITRKNFDGADVHVKYGSYGHGGNDKEGDITIGGGGDHFHGVFSASYVKTDGISSSVWPQSSIAEPGAAPGASSATPQGRFIFCDPRIATGSLGSCDGGDVNSSADSWDITVGNGVVPNYNGGVANSNGAPGNYAPFTTRFNYAPYNLLLTPNQRKSIFASAVYDINDSVSLHGKALYNERDSANQAAPEPIFLGPFFQSGGIADSISVSATNPYNPFGIDLCAVASPNCGTGAGNNVANMGFLTKRPIELGPRIYNQNVQTYYINLGLNGALNWGNGMDWSVDFVHSENKAAQVFNNGFDLTKLKAALGPAYQDASGNFFCGTPAVTISGCVPLDLFGGEARPITQQMLSYVVVTQHDASKQVLDVATANLTGDLWHMGDNLNAGFAVGYEHRRYAADFSPDPLRFSAIPNQQASQDAFAAPISSSYTVDEGYAELQVPWFKEFSTDFAVRYSNYSTFGGATTGKAGFRWQPIEDFVLRGTYSSGFRAPNIGELHGLAQFGPTLKDPCDGFGTADAAPGTAAYCAAQGVPVGFNQANTQVTSVTGGNPNLKPEKSRNFNLGGVWSPSWADNTGWSSKLDFEADYFHYKISNAIQAPDIQAIINACSTGALVAGECGLFVRPAGSGGNLGPIIDTLANLGQITTSGLDLKANWVGPQTSWGQLSAALQATHTISYRAVDEIGFAFERAVGVETDNSAIPSWQTNVQFGWKYGDWNAEWNVRYISSVTENCQNAGSDTTFCPDSSGAASSTGFHKLGSTVYNDVQLAWDHAFGKQDLKLSVGANNVFAKDPPPCVTCTLNGYDAGTYDLPFRFVYAELNYKF